MRDEVMLTPSQVAVMLGVTNVTVKKWEDMGRFRGFRTAGGHRRYRPSEIERFIRDQRSRWASASDDLIPFKEI